MKKKIRIAIVDFAHNEGYLVKRLLSFVSDKYEFEVTEDNPDFILHSCFGWRVLLFDGIRIFFSAENCSPDFNISDYAIGMDRINFGDRFFRIPLYRLYSDTYPKLVAIKPRASERRPEFCSCVISNSDRGSKFAELFNKLSKYNQIISGGKLLNNVGGRVPDKIEFMKKARFGLAIENTSAPGYITEKIADVFASGAIPIYFGAPDIADDFNKNSFVNIGDYPSIDDAVKEIIEIDQNEARYQSMVQEPVFSGGKEPCALSDESIASFLSSIFDQPYEQAFRRNRIARGRLYEKAMRTAFFKPHVQVTRLFREWSRSIRKSKTFFHLI